MEQYAKRLTNLNIDEIVTALEGEIQRRKVIRSNIEINRERIREKYTPANQQLFMDTEYFNLPISIEGIGTSI